MSFLQDIKNAYKDGMNYGAAATNRFWIHNQKQVESSQDVYDLRDQWYEVMKSLKERKKSMNWLERLAFELGDDNYSLSWDIPLKNPIPLVS